MCSTNVFVCFFCFLDSLNACTSNRTRVQSFWTLTHPIHTTNRSQTTTMTTSRSQTTTTIANGSQTTTTTPNHSQTTTTNGNPTGPTTTSYPAGPSKNKKSPNNVF